MVTASRVSRHHLLRTTRAHVAPHVVAAAPSVSCERTTRFVARCGGSGHSATTSIVRAASGTSRADRYLATEVAPSFRTT